MESTYTRLTNEPGEATWKRGTSTITPINLTGRHFPLVVFVRGILLLLSHWIYLCRGFCWMKKVVLMWSTKFVWKPCLDFIQYSGLYMIPVCYKYQMLMNGVPILQFLEIMNSDQCHNGVTGLAMITSWHGKFIRITLTLCKGNPSVTGGFRSPRVVIRWYDIASAWTRS